MSARPRPPTVTQRMLWAEAIGRCMNPDCQSELIRDGVSIGQIAHIKAHSDGGDVSFENLILLCSTCHIQIDASRTRATIPLLEKWKSNRNAEIAGRFTNRFSSFEDLRDSAVPILKRNAQIFDSYGPNGESYTEERYNLWLKFESEIVSNNRRLELILTSNKRLLHEENQEIVDSFVAHAREFVETRKDKAALRVCLFPQKLLSIFGIAQTCVGLPPNLSALQNFVSHLIDTDCFISLGLNEEPCLTYLDKGETVMLMLEDRPRVQQIFWNGRFFRPRATDVRIGSLVFFVRWLSNNGIGYRFPNMRDLTALIINGEHKVRLFYKYVLSISDMHTMTFEEGDMVVNLHNWNGAPISDQAREYASQIGVRLFSQDDFFIFAHRNLK